MKNYVLLSMAALMLTISPITAHAEDAKKPAPAKSAIDTNGDDVISKAESDAVTARDFTPFDTNKDGKISKDEFKTFIFSKNSAQLSDEANKKKAEPVIMKQFAMLDENADGSVSKAEFMEDSTKRFKAMDENGDGKVTKPEIASVEKKMKAQFEKMKAAYDKKKAAEKK